MMILTMIMMMTMMTRMLKYQDGEYDDEAKITNGSAGVGELIMKMLTMIMMTMMMMIMMTMMMTMRRKPQMAVQALVNSMGGDGAHWPAWQSTST